MQPLVSRCCSTRRSLQNKVQDSERREGTHAVEFPGGAFTPVVMLTAISLWGKVLGKIFKYSSLMWLFTEVTIAFPKRRLPTFPLFNRHLPALPIHGCVLFVWGKKIVCEPFSCFRNLKIKDPSLLVSPTLAQLGERGCSLCESCSKVAQLC